jgi:hypothetical protein
MKRIFSLMAIMAVLASASCQKSKGGDNDIPNNSPRTEVPAEMLTPEGKYWSIGTVSSVYFTSSTGPYYNYVRNGGGVVVFFKFKPGGYFENLVYVVANSYGTETETWTSVQGTVEFTTKQGVPVFITHATKGTYRIRKNGSESSRAIPANELGDAHSNTFIWELKTDDNDPTRRYCYFVNLDWYPEIDLGNIAGTVKPQMVNTFHVED